MICSNCQANHWFALGDSKTVVCKECFANYSIDWSVPHRDMRFHNVAMTKIWDRLYQGCYYDAEQLLGQNPHDITAVVNCTRDRIDFPYKAGAKFNIDTVTLHFDDGQEIPAESFWKGLNFIRSSMWHGQNVLVHCHAGRSRSTTIVASYMYLCGFADIDRCLAAIQDRRPIATPAPVTWLSAKKHLRIWPHDGSL